MLKQKHIAFVIRSVAHRRSPGRNFLTSAHDRWCAYRRVRTFGRVVELPKPLTLEKLIRFVELVTERPIHLIRRDELLEVDMSGFWHEDEDANKLFHVGDPAEFAGEMNILHELAHVLLEHDPEPLEEEELVVVFPDLDPRKVVHGWKHTKLRTGIEAEAELLADYFFALIREDKPEDEILGFGDVIG